MTPDREDAATCLRQPHWQRRIPARTPQETRLVEDNGGDTVVDMTLDRPVVNEEAVGDMSEPCDGFVFTRADRLVAHVAGCRDDWEVELGQEQMVQRRGWEHHAER